jgi:hypothetical protein
MIDSDEIVILPNDEADDESEYLDVPYEDVGDDIAEEETEKRRWLWAVLLVVGIVIGLSIAFAMSWFLRPAPYDDTALTARVAALQSDITALENRPDPVMPTIPTVNLTPLRQRISALEARPEVDPLSEEIVARMEALQADGFEVPVMPELPEFPDFDAMTARINALEDQLATQAALIAATPDVTGTVQLRENEPFVDPDTLPRFPAQTLREGAAELGGSGFLKRTFSRHVRVRGSDAPDVLISGIETDLANGKPRAALAKFNRLPPELRTLARAWRANMEETL